MILLLGDADLPDGLARFHEVVRCTGWDDLLARAPRGALIVVSLPHLSEHAVRMIARLRRLAPDKPVVLRTSPDPENVRQLARVVVDAVIWIDDPPEAWRAAAAQLLSEQFALDALHAAVGSAEHLSPHYALH